MADSGFVAQLFDRVLDLASFDDVAELVAAEARSFQPAYVLESLSAARVLRRDIVSEADRASAHALFSQLVAKWHSNGVQRPLSRVRAFLQVPVEPIHFRMVCYPLARSCGCSVASLTGTVITIGTHPSASVEGLIAVGAHELVHAWVDAFENVYGSMEEPFSEAVVTALSNGWIAAQIGHVQPAHLWYDDAEISRQAEMIYGVVAEALSGSGTLSLYLDELTRRVL
jgi:hypothetical protein